MLYKFQYLDQNERRALLDTNKDKSLIEEQNITEGNFLIFSDIKPLETELVELKQQQSLMQQAIDDLILGGAL